MLTTICWRRTLIVNLTDATVARIKRSNYGWLVALILLGCVTAHTRIGVEAFHVAATSGGAPAQGFAATLWYPTNSGVEQALGESRIRVGYRAVPDALPVLDGPSPLVLLNHGSGGSAESMAWLALHFARRGALVAAADHPASAGGNPERAGILELWTQPQDTERLLSEILSSPWGRYVDRSRIAVVGFSLGGTAALSLAGAQLQLEKFISFCAEHDDGACRAFRPHFDALDAAFLAKTNADLRDPRIRAAVAIAPGFSESVVPDSIADMTTPLLIIAGSRDQQLPPRTHMRPIATVLAQKDAYLEIEDAQHFSFLPLCRSSAREVLAETNEEFVCEEFGGRSRADIHAETLGAIDRFFRANHIVTE